MTRTVFYIITIFLIALISCRDEGPDSENQTGVLELEDIPDWSQATHSNDVDPNYTNVFRQNEVLRIDIKIDPDNWMTMLDDLQSNLSSTGNGGPGGGPAGFSDFDPVWVTSSVFFEGLEWYKVGIRFKGNSSLHSTYRSGIYKLSFKLDFDQFEDEYPIINNQRFYGFKQLNLKNNFEDASMMREKVGSDLFRSFRLVSSQASFCELYVDFGEGSQYFGVYTLVEEVDDTVLDSQLGSDSGNLYKPDGDAASFAGGTFDESEMEKKNNEEEADYSDVQALYDVINSSIRNSDEEQWRQQLESIFDVDVFLKWLAANTAMQNWDTYGLMTHNYYLYNNPENNLLTWIPWDNNESLQDGKMGGALSLSLNEVNQNWPLIRYLLDVPEYKQKYEKNLESFVTTVFPSDQMVPLYESYYNLLKNYAYAEESGYSFLSGDSDFDRAVEELMSHVQSREQLVYNHLGL